MTIYDILAKLITGEAFHGYEREEALKVIDGLRQLNAFGTATGQTRAGEHRCVPFDTRARQTNCIICDRRMSFVNGAYV